MASVLRRGKLTDWQDNRGFGFISPAEGGKKVFLHISALKSASRRPRVGDIILYQLTAEASGKIRAARASIQGVALQTSSRQTARKQRFTRQQSRQKASQQDGVETLLAILKIAMAVIAIPFAFQFRPSRSPSVITSITKPDCIIKGNISISSGNKLYHLPGMEDYESTVISPEHGEKWFCTEAEAASAGWQKAPR